MAIDRTLRPADREAVTLEMFALPTWRQIPIEDPRASRFADGHYSRQTPGAKGFVAAGRRFALWHEGPRGPALWAVCLNLDPVGALRWRNTMFRNESGTLSSELVVAATRATFDLWERIYRELPSVPLETEVDIEATRSRRSRNAPPESATAMPDGWRSGGHRESTGVRRRSYSPPPAPFRGSVAAELAASIA